MSKFVLFCIVSLSILLQGCRSLGPSSIQSNRGAYIEALSRTDKEEMLANIVRARYNDPPVFMKVKTISAAPSLEMGTEMQAGAEIDKPKSAYIHPKFIYKEAPTILYTPLMGTEYSTQLLMPMGLMNLFLMLNNGFDMEVIADLMIITINGQTNSRTASDSSRIEFRKTLSALNKLYRNKMINFATTKDMGQNADPTIVIDVHKDALGTEEYKYLMKEMDINNTKGLIEMKMGFNKKENVLAVNTRSFLALINYLSNYVDVPVNHSKSVLAPSINTENGHLHIYTSRKFPDNANTAVYMYNNWYYIQSEDVSSQNILYLLQILFDLQAHIGSSNGNIQLMMPIR